MDRVALIIDCDPGVDDAVGLLLALALPARLDVRAITTVAGNVNAVLTARNARLLAELAGRPDVPVHAGCDRPLVRPPVEAGDFHGETGLGNLPILEPQTALASGHAALALASAIMNAPSQTFTIAMMGPMTNLALAMRLEPAIAGRIKRVVAMGGARSEGGNITASSEYNIHADPHAAQIVLSAGTPLTLIGLDATHQVRSTTARTAALRARGGAMAETAAGLMAFSNAVEATHSPIDGAPLHDPCTIAAILRPDLFTTRPAHVSVELASPVTLGHTAIEFRTRFVEPMHIDWVTAIDAKGVFDLLEEALSRRAPSQ